jgi:hypothetical protein
MREIEVLRLGGKKPFDEEKIKRRFVSVKARKKVARSLRKDLLRNYGFKLADN